MDMSFLSSSLPPAESAEKLNKKKITKVLILLMIKYGFIFFNNFHSIYKKYYDVYIWNKNIYTR